MKRLSAHIISCCLAMAALVAVVACGGDDDDDNGYRLRNDGNAAAVQPTTSSSAIASRLEVPALKSGNTFVYHNVQYNEHTVMNYCLEFDPVKMHSRWVAFRFDGDTRQRKVSRTKPDPFTDDPVLPQSMWIGAPSYTGYDRGHLVASNDRLFCREANVQTFYMSNISPQMNNFNSTYWARLEGLVQQMGWNKSPYENFEDTLYVVKGGYIDDNKDLKGWVSRANGSMVAVPGHYFMALLRVKGPANNATSYDAAGFWIEHRKDYPYSDTNSIPLTAFTDRKQVVTIDKLEELTGIDFFHNLPDNIESVVEADLKTGIWLKQ